MKPPYTRPGRMGLYCGDCHEALMVASKELRGGAEVWSCQRCLALWNVPPQVIAHASRATAREVTAKRHG